MTPVATARIVGKERQPFLPALLCELADKISLARAVGRFKVAVFCVEHAIAVMMTAREGDVLHASFEREVRDLIDIEVFSGEPFRQFVVFLERHLLRIQHPLARFHQAIDSVVHKEPVLCALRNL